MDLLAQNAPGMDTFNGVTYTGSVPDFLADVNQDRRT